MIPLGVSLLTQNPTSNIERRTSNAGSIRRSTFDVGCSMLFAGIMLTWCGAIAGCKSTVDNVDIKDVYGPAGRQAKNLVEQAQRDVKGDPTVGLDEFNAAQKLYEEQKY